MEIHHACHRRPSDYHQPRPRPQGRSGLLAAAVAGDVPARAVPGRAPPRPDRGVRPSGRPSDPAPALPSPHREGRPGAGPAEPPRQSRRWYPGRGTRPFTFKTTFGEVTVQRSRISHKHDDTIEVPSARAWETSHQLHITRNLRDAVCDQFSDRSAGESRAEVCRNAGDEDLLGLSTIIDIVHQEGEQLVRAERERGRAVLDGASEAQLALLGPAVADPDALTGLVDDDLPLDDSEEAQLEWEQVQAEWIATGFPGCEPAFPVAKDKPRAVDEGFVIVEPDEVKTKAQPSTGRKEVWTFTAVVLVAGLRYAFAEATAEGLWLQVSALLLQLGVLSGERRLLVLGDGAAWIRAWFESLGISLQAMILCWWHLRKRCYESMSSAGGQGSPPRVRERAAGAVVGREGERGDRTSEGGIGVGEEPCCGRGTHRVPGEAASVHSQLPATATGGVMDRQHTGGEIQ